MKNALPKVTVVMSIYKPKTDYLIEQINSIKSQTYKNLELLIWDDYENGSISSNELEAIIGDFPYEFVTEGVNKGYIKAFEKLTELAKGEYIAFCDQDDVWKEDKIEICIREMQKNHAILATSDREIIDKDGNVINKSVRHRSKMPEDTWSAGDDITDRAVFTCFAIGMSIVAKTDMVKQCMPFPKETGHDKWITMCCSTMGKVIYIDEVLQSYRRHGKNVSGILIGIQSKKDYYEQRVEPSYIVAEEFIKKFPDHKSNKEIAEFALARKNRNVIKIFRYRNLAKSVAFFELILALVPNCIFCIGLKIPERLCSRK